jgi:hypothetical protein
LRGECAGAGEVAGERAEGEEISSVLVKHGSVVPDTCFVVLVTTHQRRDGE